MKLLLDTNVFIWLNVRTLQRLNRHPRFDTLIIYDDKWKASGC